MSKKRNVCIINSSPAYVRMFRNYGWKVVPNIFTAHLVQFTGGEDVHPSYYNEVPHPKTHHNVHRDRREALVFSLATKKNIPMAGICRGGQFLNVMCGGKMWQDVDGHIGPHDAEDMRTGEVHKVTSTHHQMMIPSLQNGAQTILVASTSTRCTKMGKDGTQVSVMDGQPMDTEAVFYPRNKVLCFQPHPEFADCEKLSDLYFSYIDEFLFPEMDKDK